MVKSKRILRKVLGIGATALALAASPNPARAQNLVSDMIHSHSSVVGLVEKIKQSPTSIISRVSSPIVYGKIIREGNLEYNLSYTDKGYGHYNTGGSDGIIGLGDELLVLIKEGGVPKYLFIDVNLDGIPEAAEISREVRRTSTEVYGSTREKNEYLARIYMEIIREARNLINRQ